MNLTPELREQARLSILRYCLTRCRNGLIRAYLRGEGLHLDNEQADQEITYLEDKGLIRAENKIVSPENKFWRTTADGRDYLATQKEES